MKRAVKAKNLIAFAVVLIVLISITATPVYAEFPPLTTAGRRLGAFLLSAIQAINITLSSTAAQSQGADIMNYIADPLDIQYSYSEMWEDQPKIQIWKDYVNIDGVEYTDVWISNEAATKFQVNAYDFQSAYNIASNSNGTFVSGRGTFDGLPVYNVNNQLRTQNVDVPNYPGTYQISDHITATLANASSTQNTLKVTTEYGTSGTQYVTKQQDLDIYLQPEYNSQPTQRWREWYQTSSMQSPIAFNVYSPGTRFTNAPFDFDFVSTDIPAERVLDPDEGMMLRIPSDRIPDIGDFVIDYPEFTQPGGAPIDIQLDPDIMNKLDDLIDIIAPIIPIINNIGDVQFTVNHAEPTPPIPDTPIVDATVPQVVNPIINEITNYGDQITEQIPQIIETIPTIDSICENIDTAPYHDLDTGLDHLPSFFLPFITDLRSALGIWHYVTEWLSQISTTFAFLSGCLVGTSIMTPIYAAIAGFMCIKIYRRMCG